MYDLKYGGQQTLGNFRHEACWTKKYGGENITLNMNNGQICHKYYEL